MKFVIPVSGVDKSRLAKFCQLLKKLGGLESHTILIASTEDAVLESRRALDDLTKASIAGKVELKEFTINLRGWPKGPNAHFFAVAEYLAIQRNPEPWMWLELDCCPLKPNWANAIAVEYAQRGAKFLGFTLETPHYENGVIRSSKDDKMMIGCAVYAPDTLSLKYAKDMFLPFQTGRINEPFDKYLRNFFASNGVAHTDLIGDRWNTIKCREVDGELLCESANTKDWQTDHSKTDVSQAVIIHGVKDESLIDLILAKEFGGSLQQRIEDAKKLLEKNGYTVFNDSRVVANNIKQTEGIDIAVHEMEKRLAQESRDSIRQINVLPNRANATLEGVVETRWDRKPIEGVIDGSSPFYKDEEFIDGEIIDSFSTPSSPEVQIDTSAFLKSAEERIAARVASAPVAPIEAPTEAPVVKVESNPPPLVEKPAKPSKRGPKPPDPFDEDIVMEAKITKFLQKDKKMEEYPDPDVILYAVEKFYALNKGERLTAAKFLTSMGVDITGQQQFLFRLHLKKHGLKGWEAPFILRL